VKNVCDVAVVGLGAMGSAAAYQLAKRGARVIAIDRFDPPHQLGSSGGDTRITRQAIGEGETYTPLALRSYELWREMEALTGQDLLTVTGGLMMTSYSTGSAMHGKADFLGETIRAARKYSVGHEILGTAQIRQKFPQFNLFGDERGYYEPMAGFLRPENCIRAQIGLARRMGTDTRINHKVIAIKKEGSGMLVIAEYAGARSYIYSDKVIISAGAWVNDFLRSRFPGVFKILRQCLFWFDINGSIKPYLIGRFPIFIWVNSNNFIYGFPAIDGLNGGIKVASEETNIIDPDNVNRDVTDAEVESVYAEHIVNRLPGLSPRCIRSKVCMYTVTPDSGFVIDFDPENPNIIMASPCSGHGFKHSAAIGESLAQLALDGRSKIDIGPFSIKRFLT